ncbi:MAG TPA: RNA 2',3'-cyclic phosphodiesterase [Solirubrobacteraceae bacterium]|nr:RNA 2',3'-cyclic phosphodiesterase [Solirubrobacteraceae bacterium]
MARGAAARLFVAVYPPAQAREQLAEWARGVAAGIRAAGGTAGALRLLDPELLHLTLCFLGSRPVGEIEPLADALHSCVEHACELSAGAPLWLPARRPRALAVEVHDRTRELTRMHEHVSQALAQASGWEPERRRFRPHITLARVRGRSIDTRRRGFAGERHEHALPATPPLSFTPLEVVLYRSWLAPEGSSYEPLASASLMPAACENRL